MSGCWRATPPKLVRAAAPVRPHRLSPSLPPFLPPSLPTSVENTRPRAVTTGPCNATVWDGNPSSLEVDGQASECNFPPCTYKLQMMCPGAAPRLLNDKVPVATVVIGPGYFVHDVSTSGVAGGDTITCEVELGVTDRGGVASSTTTTLAVRCAAVRGGGTVVGGGLPAPLPACPAPPPSLPARPYVTPPLGWSARHSSWIRRGPTTCP